MDQTHEKSFYLILTLLFLLPLFFIPGGLLTLEVSKAALFVLGVVLITLTFLWEVWRRGELNLPWHISMVAIFLLPLVYLLSALLSTPSSLSLFGYIFEVGTFGYMILAVVLMLVIILIFNDSSKVLQAVAVFLTSFALVAIFALIKLFTGGSPIWSLFTDKLGTPLGRWTDLATAFGLLSLFSMLVLGMIPMKKSLRILLYVLFVLSLFFLIVLDFSTAFILTMSLSLILLIYFSTFEKHFFNTGENLSQTNTHFISKPVFLPTLLFVISLLFLINPTISQTKGKLSSLLSNTFHVSNTEVRPSFSATLSVSKAALARGVFLGSGPNTFGQDWLIHKPVDVNTTPFWGAVFPFGIGFIPTQLAATGLIGILLWLAFFALLIFLGLKALKQIPESRALRFALISTYVALLYLWIASFLYAPSLVMLTLAFIFSGLFLAACRQAEIIPSRLIVFSQNAINNFLSTLLIVVVALGSLAIGYLGVNRMLSSLYLNKAVKLANTDQAVLPQVESLLNRANQFSPTDINFVALSRVHFTQAQQIASDTKNTPEQNLTSFQEVMAKSISEARQAVSLNSAGYQNWIALGMIYGALVPKPLAVAGAYESAKQAYTEARARNPLSPETLLLLAQLEINHEDKEAARSLIHQAIALKEDYVDAYVMLAQLEIQENNLGEAISSAERIALLVPGNPAIYFELGLLKYTNKDYTGAVNAFGLALAAAPDYANAKYYLGLSYLRLDKKAEALPLFESLALANPDNQELQTLLANLHAGKSPF